MTIKILGTGCPNCIRLEDNAKLAVSELSLKDVEVQKVSDISEIIEYGIMSAPAIVINDEVKAAGRVPDIEEIKNWIQ